MADHHEPAREPAGRRRAVATARRRPGPLTVLAVLIPLLTIAALALVRAPEAQDPARPPDAAPQSRSTVVCPASIGRSTVWVASAEGASGEVLTRTGGEDDALRLGAGTETLTVDRPVSIQGEDDLAPGLLAARAGQGRATACTDPAPEEWFTGVGAAAEHSSVLSLTNPDKGPAVADVTVLGADGPVDVPALRGVRVTGGRTATFDLSEVVPSRDALALRVVVTRGRLGAHVHDVVDTLARGGRSEEWLPGQAEPAATSYVVGLGGKRGDRTLTVANPGDSETRVEVRLVSEESEFAPAGLEEVVVDPQSVTEVDLSRVLGGRAGRGTFALRLDATAPVTAALRTFVAGDLSLAVAGPQVAERAAIVVPEGAKRLVLAGSTAPGVLTWQAFDAAGRARGEERIEIDPGTGERLPLPSRATLVELTVERSEVVGSVEVGPPGLAVIPMRELVSVSQVPDVEPALR